MFYQAFVNELLKVAKGDPAALKSWGRFLSREARKQLAPTGGQFGEMIQAGKTKVRKALQDPKLAEKGLARLKAGGGELAKTPAAGGAKQLARAKGIEAIRGVGKRVQQAGVRMQKLGSLGKSLFTDPMMRSIKAQAQQTVKAGKKKMKAAMKDPHLLEKAVHKSRGSSASFRATPAYKGGKKFLGREAKGKMQRLGKKMQHIGETAKLGGMPFLKQRRPSKVKDIYKALKREHPRMPAGMKARIAARQGKPGKQKQGPPYKGPLSGK